MVTLMLQRMGIAVVVASIVAVVGLPGTAYAHNRLRSGDPAAGSSPRESPAQVTLEFSERLDLKFTGVAVTDIHNGSVVDGPVQINGFRAVQRLRPSLPPGQYTVAYRVTSKDGHTVSDAYVFSIPGPPGSSQQPATASAPGGPPPRLSQSAGTGPGSAVWLAAGVGLAVLTSAVVMIVVRRRGRRAPTGQE
jgi:methionine-rich copper-binding protein CopC